MQSHNNDRPSFTQKSQIDGNHTVSDVDLVPMINVVFLLLIFFMVVGVFRARTDTQLKLPVTLTVSAQEVDNTKETDDSPLEVLIDSNGSILFNGESVTQNQLSALWQSQSVKQNLLVKADASAPANSVIELLNQAKALGFEKAGLQTVNTVRKPRQ